MFFNPFRTLSSNVSKNKQYTKSDDEEKYTSKLLNTIIDEGKDIKQYNNNSGLILHPILLNENIFTNIVKNLPLHPGHTDDVITHYIFSGVGYKKRIAPVCHFIKSINSHDNKIIENTIDSLSKMYNFEISYHDLNKNGSLMMYITRLYIEENGSGEVQYVIVNGVKIDSIIIENVRGHDSCIVSIPMYGISSCYRRCNIDITMKVEVVIKWSSSVLEEHRTSPKLLVDYCQSAFKCEHELLKGRIYPSISRFTRAYPMTKQNDVTYTFRVCKDILQQNKLVNGFLYTVTICLNSNCHENDKNIYVKELKAYLINKKGDSKEDEYILQNISGTHALMNFEKNDNHDIKIIKNKQYKGYTMNFVVDKVSDDVNEFYIHGGAINLSMLSDDSYQMYIETTLSNKIFKNISDPIIVLQIEGENKFLI